VTPANRSPAYHSGVIGRASHGTLGAVAGLIAVLALAGCGGGEHLPQHHAVALNNAPTQAPAASQKPPPPPAPGQWPRTWVSYTAGQGAWLVQWAQSGGTHLAGQVLISSLSGTQVSTQSGAFTGTVSEGAVELTFPQGLGTVMTLTGSVTDRRLTLNGVFNGSPGTAILVPSTVAAYDTDVQALKGNGAAALAAQQQAAAAQQAQQQAAQQAAAHQQALNSNVANASGALAGDISTAQGDYATVQGDLTTLQGDVTTLQGDLQTIASDWTTEQSDAQQNNCQGDTSSVDSDLSSMEGDQGSMGGDIASMRNDMGTLSQDSTTVANDWRALQSAEAADPSDTQDIGVSAGQEAQALATIQSDLQAANGGIATQVQQANALVNQAKAIDAKAHTFGATHGC